MRILATFLMLTAACQERSRAEQVIPPPETQAEQAPLPPPGPPAATHELTSEERALVGTWVAEVDARATRSKTIADMVMFGLQPGRDLVTGTMEAIESDNRVATSCIWLELYEDLTGFRNECALFNGEPSALDKTDPLTGKKSRFGVAFDWKLQGKTVAIDLGEPLLVAREGTDVEVKRWNLTLGQKRGDATRVEEGFPEHDFILPVQYPWEIYPGSFLGEK
jgi:hypothetical protein